MPNQTLHLIVTDYDIRGLVTHYGLDELFTPKLVKAVNDLKLKLENSAICYTSFSEETLSQLDTADILLDDIWQNRAEEYSDPYLRPDDHFVFQYSQGVGRIGVEGAIPWLCKIQERGRKKYSQEIEHWRSARDQFKQILEGNLGNGDEFPKVGAIIDCTDHPLMQPFLEDLGYEVRRQEVFNFGPWPQRK
ncbi:MAG: hypothetical protein AABX31_01745 [Nanoarchaeota archaeon]